MTFVTGGSLLSLAGSNVNALADVAGKSVAVVTGTTSEAALRKALTKNLIDAKVVAVTSREEAMKQLDAKQVAAFASDQIVLIGQIMQSADPKKYSLARELFSYEPYAFVVRRDDSDFRLAANRALAQVYRTGQIEQTFRADGSARPASSPRPCSPRCTHFRPCRSKRTTAYFHGRLACCTQPRARHDAMPLGDLRLGWTKLGRPDTVWRPM